MKPVAGIDCGPVRGRGVDQKPLLLARLPIINQMTVAARAFISKITRVNTLALSYERDPILFADFVPVHRLVAAVPHAENQPALCPTVYLYAELTAPPAAGLEVGPYRRFHTRDFAIKRVNVREP